jgi:ribonucleotide monophosphatase NagD (HAD superfamily)
VATSAQAGAAELLQHLPAGAPVLAVGGDGVREALRDNGFRVVDPEAAGADPSLRLGGVLQGYGANVTAADLAEASYAVAAGAVWVASNMDETLPTHRGTAPGNGMLVAAVRRAVGRDPIVVGKPYAPLYVLCASRLGLSPHSLLAVGDRLETDIAGACAAGLDSVFVLTGVDSVRTLAGAPAEQRPTYLLPDLRDLAEVYVAAETDYTWWVCGADRRRIVDGAWDVATKGSPIEAARAGIACLHEALDDDEIDPATADRLAAELDEWQ